MRRRFAAIVSIGVLAGGLGGTNTAGAQPQEREGPAQEPQAAQEAPQTQAAADHPDIAKLVVIGQTVQGQDIVALKVTRRANSTPDGARPATLFSGAQH